MVQNSDMGSLRGDDCGHIGGHTGSRIARIFPIISA